MKANRILPVLAALSLLLTSCGTQRTASPLPPEAEAVYTAETSPCGLPLADLTAYCVSGDTLYLAGSEEEPAGDAGDEVTGSFSYSGSADGDSMTFSVGGRAAVYRLDPVSGELTKLPDYAPPDGVSIASLAPGPDGTLWVLEQTMGGNLTEMANGSVSYFDPTPASQVWRRLDATGGQELDRVDVTAAVENLTATLPGGSGLFYAASGEEVTALDASGNPLFTCKGRGNIERLTLLSGGGVAAVIADGAGRTLAPIDPEARTWGTPCVLTGGSGGVYPGSGDSGFYYTGGDSLYSWPAGASAPQKLFSWSGAGLDSGQVYALLALPEGRFAALLRDASGWPVTYQTAVLAPAGAEELSNRATLTLATLGLSSELRAKVLAFNRTSSQYRIVVRDYSEFNTSADASAGLTKLNTEILAGNMPDLLEVSDGLPLRQYAAKGYLEDLWPYIEKDPGLGREAVMERALQAAEIDGKLCQIFPGFSLETAAGASAAVGTKMGWTLPELQAAYEKLPQGSAVLSENETRAALLRTLFAQSVEQLVDRASGTARFDTPEFQEILAFCAAFPAGADTPPGDIGSGSALARVARGEQLIFPVSLTGFSSMQIYRELLGGAASFVGYPNEQKIAARFQAEGGLALSSSCQEKDGAWSFLRQTLLPTGAGFTPYFPINRADFDRMVQDSMKVEYVLDETGAPITDSDGEPVLEGQGYVILNDRVIKMEPVTQADYDQVMALYNAAGPLERRDSALWEIVQECAGAYFSGSRTAREAAKDVQNRVTLYLNEQK